MQLKTQAWCSALGQQRPRVEAQGYPRLHIKSEASTGLCEIPPLSLSQKKKKIDLIIVFAFHNSGACW